MRSGSGRRLQLRNFEGWKPSRFEDPDGAGKAIWSPELTFLWNRDHSLRFAWEGEVVVHGHTPSIVIEGPNTGYMHVPGKFKSAFEKFDAGSRLPFLFSRGEGAGYGPAPANDVQGAVCEFDCGEGGAVEEVDVDTGAVLKYGALTAVGFSDALLSEGRLAVLTAFTTPQDRPKRPIFGSDRLLKSVPRSSRVLRRTVKAGRFGADLSDPDRNPVFPIEEFRKSCRPGD